MLTKFYIVLQCEKDFANRNMGSIFHGVLMDILPEDYVDKLHESTLKPFSQYVLPCETGLKWQICALNDECAQYLSNALFCEINEITLKKKNTVLNITERSMNSITYKHLIDNTYFSEPLDFIKIYFNTPTTFKANGSYTIFPDIEMIYKNLIRRFDMFSNEFSLYDENTITELTEKSIISAYKLQSTSYSLESVRIPSYTGWISIKVKGSQQLAGLMHLLLKFSEYSGIGIKTALGMGAVRTEEVRKIEKR